MAGASSYNVARASSSSGPFTTIQTSVVGQNFQDLTADYLTTYYYRVQSVNGAGSSPFCNPVSATTLDSFFNLTTSTLGTKITVQWPTYTGEVRLMRATAANGPYTLVTTLGLTSPFTSSLATDRPPYGTTYYYRLFSPTQGWISLAATATPKLLSVPAQIDPNPANGYLDDPLTLPSWLEATIPVDGSDAPAGGPSAAVSVDLAHGVADVDSGPDLVIRNPKGEDIVFERRYRTALAAGNLSSSGLPAGWSHNWDIKILPTVVGNWGDLRLIYPSGASDVLSPVISGGIPTDAFTVPTGAPYIVSGVHSTTTLGAWTSVTLRGNGLGREIFTVPAGDAVLRLTTEILSNGQQLNFSYSGGELTQIDNAQGGSGATMMLQLAYSGGLLQTATDANTGNVRTYAYDSGELESVSQMNDASVKDWSYQYNSVNGQPYIHLVTTHDPHGVNRTATVNCNGTTGCVDSVQDAKGNQRIYSYLDSGGGSVESHDPGALQDTNTSTCDALGRELSSRNASNDVTSFSYSILDPSLVTNVHRPAGNDLQIFEDTPHKNPKRITYPLGNYTIYTWDYTHTNVAPFGRVMSVQEFGNDGIPKAATTYDYYDAGDPSGPEGFLKTVHMPLGDVVTYTYTAMRDVLTVTGTNIQVTFDYTTKFGGATGPELYGRPYSVHDRVHPNTWFLYDLAGRLSEIVDPLDVHSTVTYNGYDQPQVVTAAVGSSVQRALSLAYAFNGKSPLSATIIAPGFSDQTVSQATYDQESGLNLSKDGNLNTDTFNLDSLFGVHGVTNANSQLMHQLTPNRASRQMDFSFGTGSRSISYRNAYGPAGNLLDSTQTSGTDSRHSVLSPRSDDPDLISSASTTATGTPQVNVYFDQDRFGRSKHSEFDSNGVNGPFFVHDYTYDDEDHLTLDQMTGTYNTTVKYTYNVDGTRKTMWVATQDATLGVEYDYTYDLGNRLRFIKAYRTNAAGTITNSTPLASVEYEWDDNDRIRVTRSPQSVVVYGYDSLGQLTSLMNLSGDSNFDPYAPAALQAPDPDNPLITRSVYSAFTNMQYDSKGNRTNETYVIETQIAFPGFSSAFVSGSANFTYDAGPG